MKVTTGDPAAMSATAGPRGGRRERLAIFTSDMGGGGAERAMCKLAGGLVRHGFDVDLVLRRAEGHYLEELSGAVRVVDLDRDRVLSALPALVRYLRRERPVALLTSLNHVNVVGAWARWIARVDTRLIVNEQNTLTLEGPNSSRRRHRMMPRLAGWFYPWADKIIAVSQGTADDLVDGIGIDRRRVGVIHNPVVTPELRAMAAEPLEHPWFDEAGDPVVVAVGRFTRQKDFGNLIRAIELVRRDLPARLLILGDGVERAGLERLVGELGLRDAVSLPGWVTNPYPYMVRADAFVLSSRWEGLPSVLIEALYCGVPVVATECPSGPMEILDGGRHGALVPVSDTEALARAIGAALAGDVPRPSEASWRPYEEDTVVRRYIEVLVGG